MRNFEPGDLVITHDYHSGPWWSNKLGIYLGTSFASIWGKYNHCVSINGRTVQFAENEIDPA